MASPVSAANSLGRPGDEPVADAAAASTSGFVVSQSRIRSCVGIERRAMGSALSTA